MDAKFESSKNQTNLINLNNSKINSKIIFVTDANKNNFNIENDNPFKCEYCGLNFCQSYNRKRHINEVHLNLKHHEVSNKNKCNIINENTFEKNNKIENNVIKEKDDNSFIGFKLKSSDDLETLLNQNKKKKISSDKKEKNNDNILIKLDKPETKKNINNLIEEKIEEFWIAPYKLQNKKSINNIIIDNLYYILNTNGYYGIGNFFMFKDLIIGLGKYGTVFFGIDVKNARPIAIKVNKIYQNLKYLLKFMKK